MIMSQESTSPKLKWILIAVIGVSALVAIFFVLYATYPANEYRVAKELQSRGFHVAYSRRGYDVWQYPNSVAGVNLRITEDDSRLMSQLPHLQNLFFTRCDMSGLNLDGIGNCQELLLFSCWQVTQFSADEIKKLAACPIKSMCLFNADLNDSGLEYLAGLTQLAGLSIGDNVGINDACLEQLESMSSLKDLHLTGTSVTKEGVKEFRKKRPDVDVTF